MSDARDARLRRRIRDQEADLWLRIHGPEIVWDDAPTSVLTAFVDSLRKGVQMVAELIDTGTLTTRPTSELKHACDLRLVGFAPGSVQVGLPLPTTAAAETKRAIAAEALDVYLDVAAWAAGADDRAIDEQVPDTQRRRVLLNAIKPLLPPKRGAVDFVELRGRRVVHGEVRLTRQTHQRLDAALDRLVVDRIETRTGVLREIDLDERTFLLRRGDDPTEVRCSFPDELGRLDFVRRRDDLVITGKSGTGKSHILKAFGLRACEQAVSMRYARCVDLLDDLHAGLADDTYNRRLKAWARPDLLIIDDVGLGQGKRRDDEPTAAHTLFNLLDRRHGRVSTAVTSNVALREWGRYLGDTTITMAILDRLAMNALRLDIDGPSYRQHVADLRAKKQPVAKGEAGGG